MERLTNKREADAQRKEYERRIANGYPRNIPEERFLRLAAYEDTGLTPAEVHSMSSEWCAMMSVWNSMGSYDRLRELAEADKDGRVVVLPCKVGTKVYRIRYEIADYPDDPELEIATTWFTPEYRDDIGKTVFLSREEAEKAMKGETEK
jgi:hypothetical protein